MWDTTNTKINYEKVKRCPDTLGELPLTEVLPSKDSDIRGAIVRIAKTNTILKRPVNKLLSIENTYQDTNHAGTAREQKLMQKAAVVGELKSIGEIWTLRELWGKESFNITIMNLLIRFNKTR